MARRRRSDGDVAGLSELAKVRVHCSFRDYTAQGYLQANNVRALRAHDIAHTIGSDYQVPGAMMQGAWDDISPHAEQGRAIGVFPAEWVVWSPTG